MSRERNTHSCAAAVFESSCSGEEDDLSPQQLVVPKEKREKVAGVAGLSAGGGGVIPPHLRTACRRIFAVRGPVVELLSSTQRLNVFSTLNRSAQHVFYMFVYRSREELATLSSSNTTRSNGITFSREHVPVRSCDVWSDAHALMLL